MPVIDIQFRFTVLLEHSADRGVHFPTVVQFRFDLVAYFVVSVFGSSFFAIPPFLPGVESHVLYLRLALSRKLQTLLSRTYVAPRPSACAIPHGVAPDRNCLWNSRRIAPEHSTHPPLAGTLSFPITPTNTFSEDNLMQAIGTQNDDLEKRRERLRKMRDKQLLEYGRACRYMCTPEANLGKPPQESSVIHLREARAEWERRHAKPAEKK